MTHMTLADLAVVQLSHFFKVESLESHGIPGMVEYHGMLQDRLQLQVSLRRSGVGESGVSSAPLRETESVRGDLFKNSKWHRERNL